MLIITLAFSLPGDSTTIKEINLETDLNIQSLKKKLNDFYTFLTHLMKLFNENAIKLIRENSSDKL